MQIQRSQVRETEHRLQQAHTEYGKRSQGAKKAVADAREASESLDSLASDEDGGSEGASQTYRGPADRVILKNLQTTIDAIL